MALKENMTRITVNIAKDKYEISMMHTEDSINNITHIKLIPNFTAIVYYI